MTSNIGSQYLLEGIKEDGTIEEAAEAAVQEELKAHFRPEFLNRLDEIILFHPLNKDNIGCIVDLMMKDLNRRLEDQRISIELTDSARSFVIEGGYDPTFGARPLRRFLQKNVETIAAREILKGEVLEGDAIVVDLQDGRLLTSVRRREKLEEA